MSSSIRCKKIALTVGEPAGIGPDIVIELLQQSLPLVEIVVIADEAMLVQRAQILGKKIKIEYYSHGQNATPQAQKSGVCKLLPVTLSEKVVPGELNKLASPYVLQTLDVAIAGCLRGEFDAMVTAPIHKGIINEAGIPFTGHTEYLAMHCESNEVVMMLASNKLRVALVTTHLPLKDVAAAITKEAVRSTIQITNDYLQKQCLIAKPFLIVAGLNPHAGENGYLGREEIEIITPVLNEMRAEGIDVLGPYPADTMFNKENLTKADSFIAMYHDQGLPVLKYSSFGAAANITLGLPIKRTSVDHGVALSLAGTGRADSASLCFALQAAIDSVA